MFVKQVFHGMLKKPNFELFLNKLREIQLHEVSEHVLYNVVFKDLAVFFTTEAGLQPSDRGQQFFHRATLEHSSDFSLGVAWRKFG